MELAKLETLYKGNVMRYLLVWLLLVSSVSKAVDCHYTSTKMIQAQRHNVLIYVDNSSGKYWKNLGTQGDTVTASYQSIAQQAMNAGLPVMLRFADGHNCNVHNYEDVPMAFRIYK